MSTTDISVMASCRCQKNLTVPTELLQPGKAKALAEYVVTLINKEGDPQGWTPESFGDETDIYLCDQDIDIREVEGKISEILVAGELIE